MDGVVTLLCMRLPLQRILTYKEEMAANLQRPATGNTCNERNLGELGRRLLKLISDPVFSVTLMGRVFRATAVVRQNLKKQTNVDSTDSVCFSISLLQKMSVLYDLSEMQENIKMFRKILPSA